METIAPGLQNDVSKFMVESGWNVIQIDPKTVVAQKRVGGNEWSWRFHFEDHVSISQVGPKVFGANLSAEANRSPFFDLIVTEAVTESKNWRDYLVPEIEKEFAHQTNRRYGTVRQFFNRFAGDISEAYSAKIDGLLNKHFVKNPVRPFFKSAEDAVSLCVRWIQNRESSRIMLVMGDPGAGKSVFALMLVKELHRLFRSDPERNPAPFLIWFTKDRPALIPDLIALTLNDLGASHSLTPGSLRFLLKQGRLVIILDGFDEFSRALAQNAEENVAELGKDINKNTLGRVLLTSRQSFVLQEEIFSILKQECGQESHEQYELAPYTDPQMHEWVVQNPPAGALQPAERHWQRVQTAFQQNPEIKELCRTPVFLRMLSEVLVRQPSVSSQFDLLGQFCLTMWERERSERSLTLSDDQYFYAYEAISRAVDSESRIEPREIKAALELYFED